MSNLIIERYNPRVVGVNTAFPVLNQSIGGFLCQTTGTITITGQTGGAILTAFPVTAGVYYPLPMYLGGSDGAVFTTASGASGTLLV